MNRSEELQKLFKSSKQLKFNMYGWNSKVSTIFAADTGLYETAVYDLRYVNDAIILEEYKTETEALIGHDRWFHTIKDLNPKTLTNVSTSKYDHHGYGKVFTRE